MVTTGDASWDAGSRSGTRRRRTPLVLGVLAIALVATGCLELPPLTADNRPTPVSGAQNGELDPAMLATVSSTCTAHRDVAPYLRRMLDDAAADGVDLVARDCYRTYELQFFWRWYWCTLGKCQNAAIPGTSIHGWGKAVDLGVSQGALTFDSPTFLWLALHAGRYGFNHPGWARQGQPAEEPWHWEWVADGGVLHPGETIPLP